MPVILASLGAALYCASLVIAVRGDRGAFTPWPRLDIAATFGTLALLIAAAVCMAIGLEGELARP